MKSIKGFFLFSGLVFFIFFIFLSTIYISSYAQSVVFQKKEEVVYQLPYPGILPDHPLYLAKIIRDQIMIFFTRDSMKKAELYLLFSDKRVAMAEELVKKNKYQLAITTFSKGEKYFFKIISLLKQAKEQGVSATNEFKDQLKAANRKHQQLINFFLLNTPKNLSSQNELLYQLNEEIRKELERL